MRGAIVFVGAFLLFLVLTLGYQDFPPGRVIYEAVVGVEVDYQILGLPATQLIIAVFNGVIYGVVIWLIYALAEKAGLIRRKQQKQTTA